MTSESTNADSGLISFVTGGTGLLGSHIAQQLRQRGDHVRALARPGSDTRFLESIGAEIIRGDLSSESELARGMEGATTVYHAAARVGDWGPLHEFVTFSIDGTQSMLRAAKSAGVQRFLHISSISVYGHVNGNVTLDESAPLGVNVGRWNYYTRTKVAAEHLVWDAHEKGDVEVTVIRPSWLYGPRDRASLPRLIASIKEGKCKILGDGSNRLNLVYAGGVAKGAILAATAPRGAGEAYNVCHDGTITQREYLNAIARSAGLPEVNRSVPFAVAYNAAFLLECFGHLFKQKNPPLVTRYAAWLMGRRCFFECQKIKDHLGWTPPVSYEEGIPAAVKEVLAR